MALTPDVLDRFTGPSVWRESDCVVWLRVISGLGEEVGAEWHEWDTEREAMREAHRLHNSFSEAVIAALLDHGYRRIPATTRPWSYTDVLLVDTPFYGVVPAGIAPGPELLIRTRTGTAPASGRIVEYLRRID